jgi:hypothetical protein
MRRRRRYGLAYLLVLLAAVGGFMVARDQARAIEMPQVALPGSVQQVITELDLFALITRLFPAVTPAPRPTPVLPARTAQPAVVQGIEPTVTPGASDAATTPAITAPVEAAGASVEAALPFALASPVRHSVDDCPDSSIRGSVRDAAGSPLAGVRLWRYDQWGNEQVIESRSEDAERGQYAFSFGDTPNIHYIQVIDAGGVIISPVVEIRHRQGEAADALCHWVDWQQR